MKKPTLLLFFFTTIISWPELLQANSCYPGLKTFFLDSTTQTSVRLGTLHHPYKSFSEIPTTNACKIRYFLYPGVYQENIVIDRPTQFYYRAKGSGKGTSSLRGQILNLSGHELSFKDMRFHAVNGTAITQRGGTLSLQNVTVQETKRTSLSASGVGLNLFGGVKVQLYRVRFLSNEGVSILASGHETFIDAREVEIYDNKTNIKSAYNYLDHKLTTTIGSISLTHHAKLVLKNSKILRSEFASIAISKGAQALVSLSTIRSTTRVKLGANPSFGGDHFIIEDKGLLELRNSELKHAKGCAIKVVNGYLKTSHNNITQNYVAICPSGQAEPNYNPLMCFTMNEVMQMQNNDFYVPFNFDDDLVIPRAECLYWPGRERPDHCENQDQGPPICPGFQYI